MYCLAYSSYIFFLLRFLYVLISVSLIPVLILFIIVIFKFIVAFSRSARETFFENS